MTSSEGYVMGRSAPTKPLARWMWWAIFILATYVMSLWFDASRAMFMAPGGETALVLLLMTGLLFAILVVLMYDSYVQERLNGKIHVPIRPFEWLISKQYGQDVFPTLHDRQEDQGDDSP